VSDPSQATKKSDVIVIGSGPLGWACAQLLSKNKIRTLLIDPRSAATPPGWMEQGLGVFWPSLNDPPTRAVVAHGLEMAQWLQDFCARGIRVAENLLGKHNIERVPTLRIALENHEIVELNTACQSQLGLRPYQSAGEGLYEEKINAGVLKNWGHTKKSARKDINALEFYAAKALKIEDSKDVCRVYLDDGKVCESEMVILATGYHIADLEPWLAHMLIPMSDVHTLWKTKIPAQQNAVPVPFRAASGHVAGIFSPQLNERGQRFWSLRLTGPRFLLPQAGAGIDLSQQPIDTALPKKIESWISKQLLAHAAPLLLAGLTAEHLNSVANTPLQLQSIGLGVDCLPCDELPMLGELGHQGRILGATGWLGCGWSAGFQAAAVLAQIVQNGKAENLKGLLRPSRWRSGMSEGVGGVTGMT
jgi:glycine/D-amino acid oxidase-like deaminating enzyme